MRRLLLGPLLVVAACSTIGSPLITSTEVYQYADLDGIQPVVFHWARIDLPVRVWVASDSPIRADVDTALARWQGAFLYGQFRATLVADSNSADVIVRNALSDIGSGLGRRAKECIGETDPDIDPVANTLQLPIHVFVAPSAADPGPGLATCYSITVTHEFGHVLGIINPEHAGTTAADVMFADPVFDGISDRDRQTVNTLYIVPSTIRVIGRRQ
jgi:hypothetical protein